MGGFWLFVAATLLLLSIPLRSISLVLVGALLLLLAQVSRWWANKCLTRLEYRHFLQPSRVFPGESVQLTTQVTNGKFLPLPWVQINDELPRDVKALQGRVVPAPDPTRIILTSMHSMKWYHRTTRTYTLRCLRRGHFYIGPTSIFSGDLFGMFTKDMRLERDQNLTVYPNVLPLAFSTLPSREPLGEVRARRTLLDDMTRPVGSRQYRYGDSLRVIHWKATAHTGQLQARAFDASTTPNIAIFLGVRTMEPPLQGTRPHLLELGVLTVTALANYALERKFPVGVYVNQTSHTTGSVLSVSPARHPDQFTQILEVMAHVHSEESITLARLVEEQSRTLSWNTAIVVVTAVPEGAMLTSLARLRRAGWSTALVHVGGPRTGVFLDGVDRYTVPDTQEWQSLQEILLQ